MEKKIKRIIKFIFPWGIINYLIQKKFCEKSISNYWLNSFEHSDVIDMTKKVVSEKLVLSIEGFGYSGSSALIDLFKEYDDFFVMGYSDVEDGGELSLKYKKNSYEVDFLRFSGGIFEIEKYIENSTNFFVNDELIHRFISLIDVPLMLNADSAFYNENFKKYVCSFLSSIIDFTIPGISQQQYNTHLPRKGNNDIYYLKNMPKEKYRIICRNFLSLVFNNIPSSKVLVMDQLSSDGEADFEKKASIIPNLKIIMVYRDPRDVYCTAKIKGVEWIPTKDIKLFIRWYKYMISPTESKSSLVYLLQFERLVLETENCLQEIESFLNIKMPNHCYPHGFFDPKKSMKNIGIWKNIEDPNIDIIGTALNAWCFNMDKG